MKQLRYPIELDLSERAVLVVGAGRVAARKLERLLACGATVRVVASHASEPVRELARTHRLQLEERAVVAEDFRGAFMVIAATDDEATNARVAEHARRENALLLRVDAASASDFTLPALAQAEHVHATVSTGGEAPAASRRLARELSAWLDDGPNRFAAELAAVRDARAGRSDVSTRLRELADGPLLDACRARDEKRISALVAAALETP